MQNIGVGCPWRSLARRLLGQGQWKETPLFGRYQPEGLTGTRLREAVSSNSVSRVSGLEPVPQNSSFKEFVLRAQSAKLEWERHRESSTPSRMQTGNAGFTVRRNFNHAITLR